MRRLVRALKRVSRRREDAPEKTWILCMNLWGARLFEHVGVRGDEEVPRFVAELPRPSQLLPDEDFPDGDDLDEVPIDPKRLKLEKKVATSYCANILSLLEARGNRFDSLVFCAEPTLLGMLLARLPRKLSRKLRGIIQQDLYEVNETDLAAYWRDLSHAKLRKNVA